MTPITDTQADAILTILAHEYDRNPSPFVGLLEELRALGEVEVPEVSFERGLRRVLETAHSVQEADSSFPWGIAGRSPSDLPGLRDCAEMPVGVHE